MMNLLLVNRIRTINSFLIEKKKKKEQSISFKYCIYGSDVLCLGLLYRFLEF